MKHTLIASAMAAGLWLAASGAQAQDGDPELRHIRVCDTSACYYAWRVLDSDRDGVSDADEIVAGTDPYDAANRPTLDLMVAMIGERMLPTFEFGLGKVIVSPAEVQAMIESIRPDQSGQAAFPLDGRKDALSRLGLSGELLSEHGIDPDSDGLTLRQDFDASSNAPYRRVGGIDMRLISAGGNVQLDDVVDTKRHDYGTTYYLKNGDTMYVGDDGHGVRQDKDGKIIDDWYVNPDADTGNGEPTEEQFKAWERIRNATMRTVADREQPTFDPDGVQDPRATIVLIDPEYADYGGIVQDAPNIDTAQPETRPDLPNPQQDGGGCWPKCG